MCRWLFVHFCESWRPEGSVGVDDRALVRIIRAGGSMNMHAYEYKNWKAPGTSIHSAFSRFVFILHSVSVACSHFHEQQIRNECMIFCHSRHAFAALFAPKMNSFILFLFTVVARTTACVFGYDHIFFHFACVWSCGISRNKVIIEFCGGGFCVHSDLLT